jgi:formiminotetrahydrofolate cyclodeaminase
MADARNENLADLSIAQFLDRVGSKTPTPGGGSAAALAGALAAALGQMVCAYTIGKPKFTGVEPRVREIADQFARARALFQGLVEEDAAAYGELDVAFHIDKSDSARAEKVAAAAAVAASVPLETAALAAKVEAAGQELRRIGNPLMRADIEASLALAQAARRAAIANVEANLNLLSLPDAERIRAVLASIRG